MPQINELTGEVIKKTSFSTVKRKNVSVQPVGSSKVVVYDFVNTYEPGPSGTKEDYRVSKKPKKIEEYDIQKVMDERCKGCDLKSIVARMEKCGDLSLLNQKNVVYGDGTKTPRTLSDALQKGVESDSFLSKLSNSEKERLIDIAKDPKKFEEFINQETQKVISQQKNQNASVVGQGATVEEKGEK